MVGGRDHPGSMSTVSKNSPEMDHAALSDVSSAAADHDLELGLSLGSKKPPRRSDPRICTDRCRILTAADFPSLSPSSVSSSSSSSSSASPLRAAAAAAAAKSPPNHSSPAAVVGWPPVRSYRMNNLVVSHQSKDSSGDARKKNDPLPKHQERRAGSLFVKANMDGDPIGRKVDLAARPSYHLLALALEDMFLKPVPDGGSSLYGAKASRLLDGASEYALTYEDKDGDWMLVGDVPWGMFLKTVKRLRIMRASEANGLVYLSLGHQLVRGKAILVMLSTTIFVDDSYRSLVFMSCRMRYARSLACIASKQVLREGQEEEI